jgi:hypothetical protein
MKVLPSQPSFSFQYFPQEYSEDKTSELRQKYRKEQYNVQISMGTRSQHRVPSLFNLKQLPEQLTLYI